MNIFYEFNGVKQNLYCDDVDCNLDLYNRIANEEKLSLDLFKISLNGKYLAQDASSIEKNDLFIKLCLPVLGGKGGFGSMLRAIGAQIEKTTNKEACRDLSGRRLRDVNAEKRIKNWIQKKAEQQKELERKKREKLERMTKQPKVDFKDDDYLNEKDDIPKKVDDVIDYVLKKKSNKVTSSTITSSSIESSQKTSTICTQTAESSSSSSKVQFDENNQPCTSSSESNVATNSNSSNSTDSTDLVSSSVDQSTEARSNIDEPSSSNSIDQNDDPENRPACPQSSSKVAGISTNNKRKINEPVVVSK